MAGRRRPAADYDAVKRSRPAFTGALTKNRDKLQGMKDLRITSYNIQEIKRIQGSTEATRAKFNLNLDEAYHFIEPEHNYEDLQLEEEEALATFEEAVSEVQDLASEMLNVYNLNASVSDFHCSIKAVRDMFTDKPEANQEDELRQLKIDHDTIKQEWKTSGLTIEHPLKKEIDTCRIHLTQLKAEMAGPKSPTPAVSIIEPVSSPSSSFREFQHYSKISDRDLPKFNGDVMRWAEFWQDFQCQIGDKDYLSDTDKIGYLRSCVTDPEAAEMLHCPRQTPGMYAALVEKLKGRYDRVTEIHRNLVSKIQDMSKVKHNRTDMRRLLESYQNTIDSIKRTEFYSMDHYLASRLYLLLPNEVQTKWDHYTCSDKEVPKVDKMLTYLLKHTEGLPAKSTYQGRYDHPEPKQPKRNFEKKQKHGIPIAAASPAPTVKQAAVSYTPPTYKWDCSVCKTEKHPLFICPKWQTMSVSQRLNHANTKKLCKNCLAVGHETASCWSKYKCKDCGASHHTTLHQTPTTPVNAATVQAQNVGDLLITSRVMVIGPDGRRKPARALLDTGAAMNLLSEKLAESLRLPLNRANINFNRAMGGELAHSSHTAEFSITAIKPERPTLLIQAAVVDHVADDMPVQRTAPASSFPHLHGLELADPLYHIPDKIDLILGLSAFLKIVEIHQPVEGPPGTPTAVNTIFGWGVGGSQSHNNICKMTVPVYASTPTPVGIAEQESLPLDFHQFWQGEELEGMTGQHQSTDDLVEQHYLNNVTYYPDRQRYLEQEPRRFIYVKRATCMDSIFWCGLPPLS